MMYKINYKLQSTDRSIIRNELVTLFLQEKPGSTEEDCVSRYRYDVENIDSYVVYLQRPAPLNKGFDFIVNVENLYFKFNDSRRHKNPSHNDIIYILKNYKNANFSVYNQIVSLIQSIYDCLNIDIQRETYNLPPFINWDKENIPIGVILACVKWLFIEQDITYWNWSGREMLFNGLKDSGLV